MAYDVLIFHALWVMVTVVRMLYGSIFVTKSSEILYIERISDKTIIGRYISNE